MPPQRPLPSCLVVGAQKSGTTSLHEVLKLDRSVALPGLKETHFFTNDAVFARGTDWYREQFAPRDALFVAEVDPDILSQPEAPARIRAVLGDVPLVVLLRDPVARAYSQFEMSVARLVEQREFLDAVEFETSVLSSGGHVDENHDYVWRALYGRHLQRLRAAFSRVLVMPFDELFGDGAVRPLALARIYDHAEWGVPPLGEEVPQVHANERFSPRSDLVARLIHDRAEFGALRKSVRILLPTRRIRAVIARQLDRGNRGSATVRTPPPAFIDLPVGTQRLLRDDLETVRGDLGDLVDVWTGGIQR